MESLLITGASGFLGWHACQQLAASWHIHGTYATRPVELPQGIAHQLHLTDSAAIAACLNTVRPNAVIHAAARARAHDCQQHPAATHAVNVTGAVELARQCATLAIPFLFVSTDLVFDGTAAPYDETDPPHPLNQYGQQKAQAEREILQVHPAATLCRLPLLYGAATPTAGCFLQGLLLSLQRGDLVSLFIDELRTPVAVNDAVAGLALALDRGIQGRLHLGGPERISRYHLGHAIAQAFGLSAASIRPCRQADVDLPAPRPADVSLDSRRAFALGYSPSPLQAALTQLAAHY